MNLAVVINLSLNADEMLGAPLTSYNTILILAYTHARVGSRHSVVSSAGERAGMMQQPHKNHRASASFGVDPPIGFCSNTPDGAV